MALGAQVIVDELERAGVSVCFGLPGVHNLALWSALRSSSMRLVGVRHEQAAAYAADGYARATGRLGVALTTTGPGAANTLGAVGEAWASRSPILVIATDIPTSLRRPGEYRGVLHETDGQAAMFAPVVKSPHVAWDAAALAGAASAAVASAPAAPTRPAYLEIATDLLSAQAPAATGSAASADQAPGSDGSAASADQAPAATGSAASADQAPASAGSAASADQAPGFAASAPPPPPAACSAAQSPA